MRRLFLTYAWIDNVGRDFDLAVQQLRDAGIDVVFDRISLVAGQRLWPQIEARILDPKTDGWGYFVTKNSLNNENCREEHAYALMRALDSKDKRFPLIAIAHGIAFEKLPASLRIRLGVSVEDRNWTKVIEAALNHQAYQPHLEHIDRIELRWHTTDRGRVLEIRPRLERISGWRFALPMNMRTSVTQFQEGPSGFVPDGGALIRPVEFEGKTTGGSLWVVGAQGPIGVDESAFIWLDPPPSKEILFGRQTGSDKQHFDFFQVPP